MLYRGRTLGMPNERCDDSLAEAPVSLWATMTKRKLKIFKTMNKTITIKTKEKVVKLKEERGLMTRLLVMSRTRTDLDVAELIKTYEFSVVPHALFDAVGNLLKCTDKADFFNDIITHTGVSAEKSSHPPTQDFVVIDGMGVVNQLKITKEVLTIQQLADKFVARLLSEISTYPKMVLVFDRYDESISNLKKPTWSSRHQEQIQYKISKKTVIKDIKLKQLLSHPQNKKLLCQIFSEVTVIKLRSLEKEFLVIQGTTILSNIPGWSHHEHNQHEADTLLLCAIKHLHHLCTDTVNPPTFRLISPDTDVFILAIHLASQTGVHIVFELLSSSKTKKVVSISAVLSQLGSNLAAALLPAYVFTGSDCTGKFNTISKSRALKTLFMLADDDEIMTGLAALGNSEEVTTTISESLNMFTVKLYISKRQEDLKRYSSVKDVADLRWELYSKRQEDGDLLPPTSSALKFRHRSRSPTLSADRSLPVRGHPVRGQV